MMSLQDHHPRLPCRIAVGLIAIAVMASACGTGSSTTAFSTEQVTAPGRLALTETEASGSPSSTTVTSTPSTGPRPTTPGSDPDPDDTDTDSTGTASRGRRPSRTITTASEPVSYGTGDNPFVPLPASAEARAILTSTGVVLPVIDEREKSWLVSTPCQNIRFVSDATAIGRAHVVLDPGHGGAEVGASGATGLREADLNLRVARRTAEILRQAGATVVLSRTGDYTITAASRGHIAKAIDPALLVSIHHNGGARPGPGGPGTIVYSKADSPESTRFGGLFHQTLQPMLAGAAEPKRLAYEEFARALDAYEAEVAAYDRSVAARDQALVANGQVPPAATTTAPSATSTVVPGELRVPPVRRAATTTTAPVSAVSPVPVPESLAPPPPFEVEPVREFHWAGTANAGVRSWIRPDGADYLAVLRHSGAVPAVLAEFAYLTNPSEEELLLDPDFVEREAGVLADAIVLFFTTDGQGTGHVADQFDDQPIGGSGGIASCMEPHLE